MPHLAHELAEDFPEYAEKIALLRADDGHFASLTEKYHELNRKVIEAETHQRPTGHFREEDLKKQRAALKDEIYQRLAS